MQSEERSLHLLLWMAAQRRLAVANDMGRRAHPAGCSTRTEPRQRSESTKPGVLWASSTTLASDAAASPGSLHDGHPATDGRFSLRSVRSGRTATVVVKGELDCVSAPLLAHELRTLLSEGTCRLTVGLAEMTFIDSTGLTTLVWALRAAREADGDVVLHAPGKNARKVLVITGADRFFLVT